MEKPPSKFLVRIATTGLIGSIAVLALIVWYLGVLLVRVNDLEGLLRSTVRDLEAANSTTETLLTRSDRLESRITALEETQALDVKASALPTREKLDALLPGLYELETSTQYDPESEATGAYTISHVVLDLRYETYGTKLHIGMARSQMIPRGVYFDYDNDGLIDVDMALTFVRDIPVFGSSLTKAYEPTIAQHLYSIFVNEAGSAKYRSIDDLSNDAEATSSLIWTFVAGQYESIEAWVFENLRRQPTGQ